MDSYAVWFSGPNKTNPLHFERWQGRIKCKTYWMLLTYLPLPLQSKVNKKPVANTEYVKRTTQKCAEIQNIG